MHLGLLLLLLLLLLLVLQLRLLLLQVLPLCPQNEPSWDDRALVSSGALLVTHYATHFHEHAVAGH
jgi:hypothetical protein